MGGLSPFGWRPSPLRCWGMVPDAIASSSSFLLLRSVTFDRLSLLFRGRKWLKN